MKKLLLIFLLLPFLCFTQIQIGQDIDGEAVLDYSGHCSISADGNIVAIGAIGNDDNGIDTGQVRVYQYLEGVWTQKGQDINGETTYGSFGSALSLSSNGSILALGSASYNSSTGRVRVYEYLSGTWTQIGQDIDGEAVLDFSGGSISLSSDGSIVAIGATGNEGEGDNSGHVRVYENQGGVWTQIGQDIDGNGFDDETGNSVSLSSDGNIVAIGSPRTASLVGKVQIFENQSGAWTLIGLINGEEPGERSGTVVSLSSDGSIVAISVPRNYDEDIVDIESVRIYENESGIWVQIGQDINGEEAGDRFGRYISLSSDGTVIAIGAFNNDANGLNSGQARLFHNQLGNWAQIGQDINGEEAGDRLCNVSLSTTMSTIAVGATSNDGNGDRSGHVRVYDLSALLSVEESELLYVKIYPNPTTNQFTIELPEGQTLEKVNLYNTLGQLVLSSKESQINTSKLASGSYIVEVITSQGEATKKLIIE